MKLLKYFSFIFLFGVFIQQNVISQPFTTFVNPANPSTCIGVKIDFDWEYTGPNTVKDSGYTLQIAKDLNFTQLVVNVSKIHSSTFSLDYGLDYETTYYWRTITEFDPSGSETSGSATFSTGDAPPRMVEPLDLANCVGLNNIYFKWENLFADDNEIDIATSSTFGTTSLPGYPMSVSGYEHTFAGGPLDKNTKYYWRVRSQLLAKCGWTDWKDTMSFRTVSDPPVLEGPADASSCVVQTADVWWAAHPGVKYYHVQFSNDAAFGTGDIVYQRDNLTSNTFTVPDGELEPYTTYYWRARVIYDDACVTNWSSAWYFKTKQSKPVFVYPASSEGGIPLKPVFTWKTDTFPDPKPTYTLQVSKNALFTDLVYDVSGITSTGYSCSFTLDATEFEYNKYYYTRVKAQFGAPDNCETEWSDVNRFKTVYPMAVPTDPTDKQTCIDLKYTFRWGAVIGANTYRLQVAKDAQMADLEYNTNNISGASRSVTLKNGFQKYYWRVRAEDATTFGTWSPVFEFTTNSPVPKEIYPKNNAVNLPLSFGIYWENVHNDAVYDLQVSKKSDMSDPIIDIKDHNSNTFTVTLPDYYETYFWKVRATANDCSTDWSSTLNFSTGLPKPVLLTPKNNSEKQPLVPIFSWIKTLGTGNKYTIEIATDNLFNDVIYSRKDIPSNSTSIDITLDTMKGYYWHVKAVNVDGESPWSDYFKFITGIESAKVPVLLDPANNTKDVPVTITLKWKKSDNANRYLLQVAKDVDFSEIEFNYSDADNLTDTTLEITGLEYNQSYYWRVASANDNSTSKWSDAWMFVTQNTPPENAPIQLAPLDGSVDVVPPVKFIWDPVVNTTKYHLQITTNSTTFTDDDLVLDEVIAAPATEFSFGATEPNTTYYWRLRAENNSGAGPWGETWSFTMTATSVEDEFVSKYGLSVSPNPAKDVAGFNFVLPEEAKVTIELYDLLGQKIGTITDSNVSGGFHSYSYNTSGLAEGVYIYIVGIADGKYLGRIAVSR